ncbi:MAG: glycosyltransferase family 39 protein [Verrucomicrobiota bacterium]|jgi:4-amino-4-deoxy-L-arabinose transferase-like glycosyltransferase
MGAAISVLPSGRRMISRLKIGQLILVFVLAAVPFAATFALYYPDERHYTDGALMMLKHGDWLVPKTAAGKPRFQKPPLAYWSVAASYTTFGVGAFTSRLPFLLASCGTLWLTYRLARRLTGNAEAALLAAIVLLSHPQFFLCSIRSTPDALLDFFITLSAYGFLRLIVFKEFAAGAFWLAYGGAAGAALSKGLLGAGIVLFAWTFAFWQGRNWRAVQKIIHLPSLASAVILIGGWFGYIFWRQGAAAINVFFNDQVTGNFHGHWWSPIGRAPLFALVLIFNFLPWSATVVEWLLQKNTGAAGNVPPLAQKFILAWTALLIVGFALGEVVSLRYLLPATPLLAVLVADWLRSAESARLIFSLRRILKMVLVALALAAAAALFVGSQWPLPTVLFVLMCGLFLFGIAVLGLGALWRKSFSAAEALGPAILLGWVIFFAAAMPILLPDRAWQIAVTLRQTQTGSSQPVLLIGDVQLASRVRVLLGKNWTVTQVNKMNPAVAADYTRILISEKEAGEFLKQGWTVQTAAINFGPPARGELWEAFKSRRLPEMLARHAQKICLAARE